VRGNRNERKAAVHFDESIHVSKWPLSIAIALLLSIQTSRNLWALLSKETR